MLNLKQKIKILNLLLALKTDKPQKYSSNKTVNIYDALYDSLRHYA